MKEKLLIIIFFASLQIFAQDNFPVNGVSNNFKPTHAFINGHIIIDSKNKIENGTLIIRGDKIIAVDSNLVIPNGSIIHDLNGDFIYPSFIDLNSGYGLPKVKKGKYNYRPQYKSDKKGAFHWNEAIHPEVEACALFVVDKKAASNYLKNGFGAVLSHVKDGIIRGTGCLVLLSHKSNHQNIIKQNSSSHLSFNKGVSAQKNPSSLMGSIALIRQTFLDAEWYSAQEIQNNLSYSAILRQKELPNLFTINDELDYSRVLKIAEEFEIDFIIKGNGKEYNRIDDVIKTKFPLIIPINFPDPYDVSNPQTSKWLTLNQLKEWESAPYNPAVLANKGVKFCITSTGNEKSAFIKNLRYAITKGLSKEEALESLTTTPAELIDVNDKLGSLDSGKLANFFIASNDIFENGEIYQNWTSGEQHIINIKISSDIRGHYTINSDNFKNRSVCIKGSKVKPEVFIFDLDSLNLQTNLEGENISLNNNYGTFRANLKFKDGSIDGKYQDSTGLFHKFSMSRDSLLEAKEKIFNFNMDSIPPSVWLPNKAYGYTSLPKEENIIFRNATVWTNEESGILKNTDIAISKGKIIAIGKALNELEIFPEIVRIKQINATGEHITSGIIDEHSHIAISKGVNESSQAVTAEVRIGDVINPNDHNIYRQLAGGTVASQLLHGSANPIGGQAAMIKLRWGSSAESMKIKDADGFIKFALGENVKQSNWGSFERVRFPQTRMGVEQVFYDAFYRAKAYEKDWKNFNSLSTKSKRNTIAPREDLELNALVDILNSKRFVSCHSYIQSEINMLMHVGDSMGFTINTFTHILEGYKVANKMKDHGAGGSTFSDWWAYKFEVNDAIPYNATLLNNAGVVTAINSDDAEMGRRLNQEAAKAVKYGGSSEEDAWKMVTLNPAKLLHIDHRMGSLKVGKDADLVRWTNNPLSIYTKAIQTYVDGRLMFDIELDKAMLKRDRLERMRIIQKMSLDKNGIKKQKPQKIKDKLYHCDTEYDE